MSTTEYEQAVEEFEGAWEEGKENPGGKQLPDGQYQATIDVARVEKKDWGWQFCLFFLDTAGGGGVWSNFNLEDEVGAQIAAKNAARLGYTGTLKGLKAACESEQFLHLLCDIKVVTKPGEKRDFTSVYVNRVHGKAGVGPSDYESGQRFDPNDDIPF